MKTICSLIILLAGAATAQDQRPNILWIMAEDMSTELACYGHPAVKTPNLDSLAAQGARYTQAFCTAPSCTPSRNAMLTGVYQTRTDTQDQRRKTHRFPAHIKPITHLLREAGYFTALGCGYSAKTDHNFEMFRNCCSRSENLWRNSTISRRTPMKSTTWLPCRSI